MRPLVGIVPIYDEDSFGGYKTMTACFGYVETCGAAPVLLPLTTDEELAGELAERLDGLLLAGGHDVEPVRYGVSDAKVHRRTMGPAAKTGMWANGYTRRSLEALRVQTAHEEGEEVDTAPARFDPTAIYTMPERDEMEWTLIERMLSLDKPMLGICRGIQLLNVYFGGTLYTDLDAERPGSIRHQFDRSRDDERHSVRLVEGTPLQRLLGCDELEVNSFHHQGVREPGCGLKPMAYAPDGLVEAVWLPGARFCWAVQWHPENLFETDEPSRALFRHFVEKCR